MNAHISKKQMNFWENADSISFLFAKKAIDVTVRSVFLNHGLILKWLEEKSMWFLEDGLGLDLNLIKYLKLKMLSLINGTIAFTGQL